MTFVVGLTGGIGSGKTVVSDYFGEIGVPIIDTDVIARSIVESGQPALSVLVQAFGEEILLASGELDRAALRQIAFANTNNKAKLDAITHPAIRIETLQQLSNVSHPYCVVVVPLLVPNSEFFNLLQRTLVVTASRTTKIERVRKRSQLSEEEVERIMQSQIDDQTRLAFADDVIRNDGSIEQAQAQADILHHKYLALAAQFSVDQ